MHTFLILRLGAHIHTTNREMSPVAGTSRLLLAGMADIYIIHTENIKHDAESECTVRNAFRIGSSNS